MNIRVDAAALDLATAVANDAGLCVACGLCLAHCPTYDIARNEADSPRGRIALMQGLAVGHLNYNKRLQWYLDRCLGCLACEAMCPSQVPFNQLLDNTRVLIANRYTRFSVKQFLRRVSRRRLFGGGHNRGLLKTALAAYQTTGLQSLLRATGLLKLVSLGDLEKRLPPISTGPKLKAVYASSAKSKGKVALFTGCVNSLFDNNTLLASVQILTTLGFEVRVPENQGCCGAIHQHAGDQDYAQQCVGANLQAFIDEDYDAIISTASGCSAMLKNYGQLSYANEAQNFQRRVTDINQFLVHSKQLHHLAFNASAKPIVVHEPCSLRNVLKQQHSLYQLLQHIPDTQIISLTNQKCCGGAGGYLLNQPQLADSLRSTILDELALLAPAILVTANIGCSLHLRTGIAASGLDIELLHPVELLDRLRKNRSLEEQDTSI